MMMMTGAQANVKSVDIISSLWQLLAAERRVSAAPSSAMVAEAPVPGAADANGPGSRESEPHNAAAAEAPAAVAGAASEAASPAPINSTQAESPPQHTTGSMDPSHGLLHVARGSANANFKGSSEVDAPKPIAAGNCLSDDPDSQGSALAVTNTTAAATGIAVSWQRPSPAKSDPTGSLVGAAVAAAAAASPEAAAAPTPPPAAVLDAEPQQLQVPSPLTSAIASENEASSHASENAVTPQAGSLPQTPGDAGASRSPGIFAEARVLAEQVRCQRHFASPCAVLGWPLTAIDDVV